ncbi:MAG: polymer-forming cytoskeletal protein [Anaerolineae bacterium]|nr:polymer-forming cytoskeletal protein [Anaerolineae bacterium]
MDVSEGDGFLKGLFNRRPRRLTIRGLHNGDIVETGPVVVARGAAVAGNIQAPEVVVSGLLHGAVVTRTVTVTPGGQIVGDIHATSVAVEAGGAIYGLVYSLEHDGYERLRNGAPPGELAMPEGDEYTAQVMPAELQELRQRGGESPEHVVLFQLVQDRLGEALMARAALEQTFAERIEEVAGDTARRLREVEEAHSRTQAQLEAETAGRAELATRLAAREEALATQRQELDGVRALLQQRAEALHEAEHELAALGERAAQLDEQNLSLQRELAAALEPVDWLKGRVESLENALQASVQRGAEQEDAQLRWQELADESQRRVAELESQLAIAAARLETLRRSNDELSERLAEAGQTRDEVRRTLDELRADQMGSDLPDQYDKALADAEARSERLDAQLEAARAENGVLEEELAWSRLSAWLQLQQAMAEKEALEREIERQKRDIAGQRQELAETQASLAEVRSTLQEQMSEARAELATLRSAAAHRFQELQTELAERDEKLRLLRARSEG